MGLKELEPEGLTESAAKSVRFGEQTAGGPSAEAAAFSRATALATLSVLAEVRKLRIAAEGIQAALAEGQD